MTLDVEFNPNEAQTKALQDLTKRPNPKIFLFMFLQHIVSNHIIDLDDPNKSNGFTLTNSTTDHTPPADQSEEKISLTILSPAHKTLQIVMDQNEAYLFAQTKQNPTEDKHSMQEPTYLLPILEKIRSLLKHAITHDQHDTKQLRAWQNIINSRTDDLTESLGNKMNPQFCN